MRLCALDPGYAFELVLSATRCCVDSGTFSGHFTESRTLHERPEPHPVTARVRYRSTPVKVEGWASW
jgi:hypothetical protein